MLEMRLFAHEGTAGVMNDSLWFTTLLKHLFFYFISVLHTEAQLISVSETPNTLATNFLLSL